VDPTSERTCVLLIEDDRNIVDLVRSNLTVRGFSVIVSTDGLDALALLEREQPDIALVDLLLPRSDGFELCRQLRRSSTLGIIVVSARWEETDKVRALNLGADDYLTKPFGIEELLARINATLRRSRPAATATGAGVPVRVGDLLVDLAAQSVTKAGVPVRLTPTEFALLRELIVHRGTLLSHATLLRRVWGPGYATHTEYTRVYIRRLRAKLETPGGPLLIQTEPRSGYRLLAE
jgi:two-component system KDP operon response regulator KdpE